MRRSLAGVLLLATACGGSGDDQDVTAAWCDTTREVAEVGDAVVDDPQSADPAEIAAFEELAERWRDAPRPAQIEDALAVIFEGPDDDAGFDGTEQLLDAASEVSTFAEQECGIDPDTLLSSP